MKLADFAAGTIALQHRIQKDFTSPNRIANTPGGSLHSKGVSPPDSNLLAEADHVANVIVMALGATLCLRFAVVAIDAIRFPDRVKS